MPECCSVDTCSETAIVRVADQPVCRHHFLALCYRRLEAISGQIHLPEFHHANSDSAASFLEDCMRQAADIACATEAPDNLERAQVLDVLLWASELHSHLRRGPRLPGGIAIVLRSESAKEPWEERTETQGLSRHGLKVHCRRRVSAEQVLTCVRLDNGWSAQARVVWSRRMASGSFEAGLEFLTDTNFWELDVSGRAGSHRF